VRGGADASRAAMEGLPHERRAIRTGESPAGDGAPARSTIQRKVESAPRIRRWSSGGMQPHGTWPPPWMTAEGHRGDAGSARHRSRPLRHRVACAVRPLGTVQVANRKGESWDERGLGALGSGGALAAGGRDSSTAQPPSCRTLGAQDLVAPRLWCETRGRLEARARAVHGVSCWSLRRRCIARHARPPLGPAATAGPPTAGRHPSVVGLRHALLEASSGSARRALPRGDACCNCAAQAGRLGAPLWRGCAREARGARLRSCPSPAVREHLSIWRTARRSRRICCGLRPLDAVRGAILEAAQSRLTDVHGAREDVEPSDARQPGVARGLRAAARLGGRCGNARTSRPPRRSVARAWRSWSWSTSPCTW